MRLIVAIFLAIYCSFGYAENNVWRWIYFSAGLNPNAGASNDVFYRSGEANVKIYNGIIQVDFKENDMPEMHASFSGNYKRSFIEGNLSYFFPSETDKSKFQGSYIISNWGGTCYEHEILLHPKVRNASAIMIVKMSGACEVTQR